MQAEVLDQTTAWRHLAHCQERFDEFRNCYNTERPHEALALRVPACCCQPSLRAMAPKLPEVQYLSEALVRLVRTKGEVKFKGHHFYVGQDFGGQEVAFRPTDKDGCFDLFFSWKKIGRLDLQKVPKGQQKAPFLSYRPSHRRLRLAAEPLESRKFRPLRPFSFPNVRFLPFREVDRTVALKFAQAWSFGTCRRMWWLSAIPVVSSGTYEVTCWESSPCACK
jgi:hypothetical protein